MGAKATSGGSRSICRSTSSSRRSMPAEPAISSPSSPAEKRLEIVDLKGGKGVVVDVDENAQERCLRARRDAGASRPRRRPRHHHHRAAAHRPWRWHHPLRDVPRRRPARLDRRAAQGHASRRRGARRARQGARQPGAARRVARRLAASRQLPILPRRRRLPGAAQRRPVDHRQMVRPRDQRTAAERHAGHLAGGARRRSRPDGPADQLDERAPRLRPALRRGRRRHSRLPAGRQARHPQVDRGRRTQGGRQDRQGAASLDPADLFVVEAEKPRPGREADPADRQGKAQAVLADASCRAPTWFAPTRPPDRRSATSRNASSNNPNLEWRICTNGTRTFGRLQVPALQAGVQPRPVQSPRRHRRWPQDLSAAR